MRIEKNIELFTTTQTIRAFLQYVQQTCQTDPLPRTTYKEPLVSNAAAKESFSSLFISGKIASCLYAIAASDEVMISHRLICLLLELLDICAMESGWFVKLQLQYPEMNKLFYHATAPK